MKWVYGHVQRGRGRGPGVLREGWVLPGAAHVVPEGLSRACRGGGGFHALAPWRLVIQSRVRAREPCSLRVGLLAPDGRVHG